MASLLSCFVCFEFKSGFIGKKVHAATAVWLNNTNL